MMLKKVEQIIKNLSWAIASLAWKRDDSIVVVGAWFGTKFADNSRFLFQFLNDNKSRLGLTHVVWITRNQDLCNELIKMNYEAYIIGSPKSDYYHKYAGWHIICNSSNEDADIDVKYSYGAKKIQLWHGVAMKAVGGASNLRKRESKMKRCIRSIYHFIFNNFRDPGAWNKCAVLATSETHSKHMSQMLDIPLKYTFISTYPRFCKCLKLTNSEEFEINQLSRWKYKILYLPTFRSDYSLYTHPLNFDMFKNYLMDTEILWIEKPHSKSDFNYDNVNDFPNVRILNSDFDINVLLNYVDIVITDYSSVAFDSIKKNIPTLLYAPDIDVFANADVGFLYDYDEYFKDIISTEINECIVKIQDVLNNNFFTDERKVLYHKLKTEFFEIESPDYEKIWSDINSYFARKIKKINKFQ